MKVCIEICYNGKWRSYMLFSVALHIYVHTCIMVWDDESMRFANSISLFETNQLLHTNADSLSIIRMNLALQHCVLVWLTLAMAR